MEGLSASFETYSNQVIEHICSGGRQTDGARSDVDEERGFLHAGVLISVN